MLKMYIKDKNLHYIMNALKKISSENENERIRLVTSDKKIKELCLIINEFISKFYNLERCRKNYSGTCRCNFYNVLTIGSFLFI